MKRMVDDKVFNNLSGDVDTLKQESGKTSLYRHSLALGSGRPEHTFNWIDNDPTDISTISAAAFKFNDSFVQMMPSGPATIDGSSSGLSTIKFRRIGKVYPNVWVEEWKLSFTSEGVVFKQETTSLNDIPVFSHSVTLL